MPKLGMEPIRRDALVKATIAEVGAAGSLDVTVSQIAKRAGMSSALAHHYFGGKDQIFEAAMRAILRDFAAEVRARLARARSPEGRVAAIVGASFDTSCFAPEVIRAWMQFYARAQEDAASRRLLRLYQRRLASNLRHALRGVVADPAETAEVLGAVIDGLYLRASTGEVTAAEADSRAMTLARSFVGVQA